MIRQNKDDLEIVSALKEDFELEEIQADELVQEMRQEFEERELPSDDEVQAGETAIEKASQQNDDVEALKKATAAQKARVTRSLDILQRRVQGGENLRRCGKCAQRLPLRFFQPADVAKQHVTSERINAVDAARDEFVAFVEEARKLPQLRAKRHHEAVELAKKFDDAVAQLGDFIYSDGSGVTTRCVGCRVKKAEYDLGRLSKFHEADREDRKRAVGEPCKGFCGCLVVATPDADDDLTLERLQAKADATSTADETPNAAGVVLRLANEIKKKKAAAEGATSADTKKALVAEVDGLRQKLRRLVVDVRALQRDHREPTQKGRNRNGRLLNLSTYSNFESLEQWHAENKKCDLVCNNWSVPFVVYTPI
mmetsp:Transcript_34225/g.109915  ORF Transcript_34225/g.109915 Transcript_34225/m.109915 type:complete len:368 (+) Transcript_34225:3-1106(+)